MDSSQAAQLLMALMLGIALSASCGFRVFVPMLVVSIASHAGMLTLSSSFSWLGSWPAIIIFGVATICEVLAYYIPALDNLLDTVAVPSAAIAGTVLTASFMATDMSPVLRWVLAAIAGGGTATAVGLGTAALRGMSTATTAGIGNHVVANTELASSSALSVLSVFVPIVAFVIAAGLIIAAAVAIKRLSERRKGLY